MVRVQPTAANGVAGCWRGRNRAKSGASRKAGPVGVGRDGGSHPIDMDPSMGTLGALARIGVGRS